MKEKIIIGELWNVASPIEKLKIDDALLDYLLRKGIEVSFVSDFLLENLIKIIEKRMFLKSSEGCKMGILVERRCEKAKQRFFGLIVETKKFIKEISNVYKYYLQWPTTIDNFRSRIEVIEVEVNNIGKNFDIFEDKEGKQRIRVGEVHVELIITQR